MNPDFFSKFNEVAQRVIKDKGPITLWGLFKRTDLSGNKWDVVLAAPWITDKKEKDLEYLIGILRVNFTDLDFLAKIVLLRSDEPFVEEFLSVAPTDVPTELKAFKVGRSILEDIYISYVDTKTVFAK